MRRRGHLGRRWSALRPLIDRNTADCTLTDCGGGEGEEEEYDCDYLFFSFVPGCLLRGATVRVNASGWTERTQLTAEDYKPYFKCYSL